MHATSGIQNQYANYRPSLTPSISRTYDEMLRLYPQWTCAIKMAGECLASVYINNSRRGQGVFLERDLLLIPRHLLVAGSTTIGCAMSDTVAGDCGKIYFDPSGCLIGIHLGQSTGRCNGESGEERTFLFASDVLRNTGAIPPSGSVVSYPTPPVPCLSPITPDHCTILQADVTFTTDTNAYGYYCNGKEKHITNAQRELQVELRRKVRDPRTRGVSDVHVYRVHYQMYISNSNCSVQEPNIHGNKRRTSSYDDNKVDFYISAARIFMEGHCLQDVAEEPVVRFGFQYMGDYFIAERTHFKAPVPVPLRIVGVSKKHFGR